MGKLALAHNCLFCNATKLTPSPWREDGMLLEGKAVCDICFPCSICIWITCVASHRMNEMGVYVYAHLVVKRKKRLVSLLGFTDENKYWSHFSETNNVVLWQWPYLYSCSLTSCIITKTLLKKKHFYSICIDTFWFLSSEEDVFYYQASEPQKAHSNLAGACFWKTAVYGLVAGPSIVARAYAH